MSPLARRLVVVVLAALVLIVGSSVFAETQELTIRADLDEYFDIDGVPDDLEEPWREFLEGWRAFGSWRFIFPELVSLALAAGLALVIAFHPRCQRVIEDSESFDAPKAIMLYGVVGASIAEIVVFNPPMAFVIFGIGGLMRFRTVLGHAKDTGRAIFTAVIGLACGLKLFPLAVLGTAFVWVTLWFLEARYLARLELRKLEPGQVDSTEARLRAVLAERGCQVRSTDRDVTRGRLSMVLLIPRSVSPEHLREGLGLPPALADRIRWEWPS